MNRKLLLILLSSIGLLSSLITVAQKIDIDDLNSKIESLIPSAINDTTPGLVVGVVKDGQLIFSKGYGMANMSYGIPNNPEMIYNLGSVSKQFLGYAFAMLHTEGKINVDDPVGKYLEEWPEFEYPVTIRNLLTHTSGYREAYTMSTLAGRSVGVDRLTREECLNVVRKQPKLEFVPGSRFTYNSTAWVILAEILENVTEQSADEWVKENILTQLGMEHTHIETFVGEVLPNAAESYYNNSGVGYGNPKSNRAIFGAAEVYSSIEDMAHWLTNFQTQEVGGKVAMDLFLTTFPLNDGTISEYGFGIENKLHKGLKLYAHTGAHESFLTQIRYYPEYDLGIVTISNFGGNGWLPTNKLAEYLLQDYMSIPDEMVYAPFQMSVEKLKLLEGIYVSPLGNSTNELKLIDSVLVIWGSVKLIPITESTFYSNDWGGTFEINSLADGSTELVILADSKTSFLKSEEWEPLAKDLKRIEGDYYSTELETTYRVILKEGQLIIQHRWLGEIALTPVSPDFFKTDWGWFLQIERKSWNRISGFNINSGRTLNVFFEKNN